ncbi:unnamed protein product, partial [Staurois parvus]
MGPCTASSCCCQARNLSWAPVPPPHAAARPVICHGPPYRLLMLLPGRNCHGPLYRLLMLLPGPECVRVPVRPPIAAVYPSPHSAMCHFQVSSHCWWVPFCHRVLQITCLPLLLPGPLICHGHPVPYCSHAAA